MRQLHFTMDDELGYALAEVLVHLDTTPERVVSDALNVWLHVYRETCAGSRLIIGHGHRLYVLETRLLREAAPPRPVRRRWLVRLWRRGGP